jgi:hypothetical protein
MLFSIANSLASSFSAIALSAATCLASAFLIVFFWFQLFGFIRFYNGFKNTFGSLCGKSCHALMG